MQSFRAGGFAGARVRLSGYIKTRAVTGKSAMWMRTDGASNGAFDNMLDRKVPLAISGDTDWKLYEIVLDVPEDTIGIAFGVILDGPGQVWCDDFNFEIVDDSVPSTSIEFEHPPRTMAEDESLRKSYENQPKMPVNLNFEGRS
jgi:hypothetical protein